MSALYLDLHLEIDIAGRLRTKLYNKREDFNFPIVNFPFICSNIPEAPGYGEYISQLIRYSIACGTYEDFLDRRLLLTRKLLNQGFLLIKLKLSLRQFYGRHHDLVGRYGISVSLVEQELLTIPEHLCLPPVFCGGLCYSIFSFISMFCRSFIVLLYFSFGHCVVYSSSIYGLWLPLW
jgi:hypothetical protein